MSQLEAFATLHVPQVQIANLTVTTAAQSVIFGMAPADRSGTTVLSSPTITVANTQNLSVGMAVGAATNVPAGSYIVSIVPNTSITISQNCSAAGAVTLKFGSIGGNQIARLRITNLSSTATCAICFSDSLTTSVPSVQTTTASSTTVGTAYTLATMVSSASTAIAAGDGIRIQPNSILEINVSLDTRVWVIASAVSTPIQIACILQNG